MARRAAVWDPAQYLRFSDERLRPALDLLAQVPLDAPARVVDLGCGAGNVTAILRQRFPAPRWSASTAPPRCWRRRAPRCRTAGSSRATSSHWQPAEPLDLIYSNAALQWVDQHPTLFPRLLSVSGARRRAGGADAGDARHAVARDPLRTRGARPVGRSICAGSSRAALSSAPRTTGTCCARALRRSTSGRPPICMRSPARHAVLALGLGQQPAAVPRPAAGGAAGAFRAGLLRRRRVRIIRAAPTAPRCCRSTGCSSWRAAPDRILRL